MSENRNFFDFTKGQLRLVAVLTGTLLLLCLALLISEYATPTEDPISLPVIVGDEDNQYTGAFVLDPNTAPADSLELLPGIGKVLADRIVAYRQEQRFNTEVDVTSVKGIGPKLYERLRPYLRVRPK